MNAITVDLDTVDPAALEELAAVIRERKWSRAARLAEMGDRPALGAFRKPPPGRPMPEAPPGWRWNARCLLERVQT